MKASVNCNDWVCFGAGKSGKSEEGAFPDASGVSRPNVWICCTVEGPGDKDAVDSTPVASFCIELGNTFSIRVNCRAGIGSGEAEFPLIAKQRVIRAFNARMFSIQRMEPTVLENVCL